jgi:hypothetical protein
MKAPPKIAGHSEELDHPRHFDPDYVFDAVISLCGRL